MFRWLKDKFKKPSTEVPREALADQPVDERLLEILKRLPADGLQRWPAAVAAFEALPAERLDDPLYAKNLLRALFAALSHIDAPVRQTMALAQIALNHFPRMAAAVRESDAHGQRAFLPLAEGILALRTGQFDLAFRLIARANLERRISDAWAEGNVLEAAPDYLVTAVSLAAQTLIDLKNPDLRYWGTVAEALPEDPKAILEPESFLMAAGDLVLEIHRAAAEAVTLDAKERLEILGKADARYELLFRRLHPQAEDCRRMFRRVEKMFGILAEDKDLRA